MRGAVGEADRRVRNLGAADQRGDAERGAGMVAAEGEDAVAAVDLCRTIVAVGEQRGRGAALGEQVGDQAELGRRVRCVEQRLSLRIIDGAAVVGIDQAEVGKLGALVQVGHAGTV